MTLKPNAFARKATAEPILPNPTIPRVSPRILAHPCAASLTYLKIKVKFFFV